MNTMRFSLLCAGAALAAGLALSASSSDASATSSGARVMGQSHGRGYVMTLMPGVKPMVSGCDYSVYAFCFYVTPGNPGPYIETSAGSGELYNAAYIIKNTSKKGKLDKKFSTYFYPDPGNPTYQYITYTGKNPKKPTTVKFTDYYCIGFAPSSCPPGTYTFKLGIALQPAS
jgi:hypothetical protein